MHPQFGPAGNDESFAAEGHKTNLEAPAFVRRQDLDLYEYQCGHGVRVSSDSAKAIKQAAEESGVTLTLHAPYYISLSSVEEEKREKSVEYILQAARAADAMGAQRIVVHSGSCAKITRTEALALAGDTLRHALGQLEAAHLSHIAVCPETMGKINQLGTLEEVIELCRIDERLIPCIDFGHLYARSFGAMNGKEAVYAALEQVRHQLGSERWKSFHCHFSKIAYTDKGGEKMHTTFSDPAWGPAFEPFLELVYENGLSPYIICESSGTQAKDAKTMKDYYLSLGSHA